MPVTCCGRWSLLYAINPVSNSYPSEQSRDSPLEVCESGGLRHYRYESVGTTQEVAFAFTAKPQHPREFCVSANQQHHGRGRMGRHWQSPEGSLSLSLVLEADEKLNRLLPYLVGLGVCETLERIAKEQKKAVSLMLKWPNDVLLEGAKCAGILIEHFSRPYPMFVLGIGINTLETPGGTPYAVTNLSAHGLKISAMDLAELLVASLLQLRRRASLTLNEGIYQQWQEKAHPVGTVLKVRTEDQTLEGEYQGLSNDGALCLRLASGEMRGIYSADCQIKGEG